MKLFPEAPNLQPYIKYRYLIPAIQKATVKMEVMVPSPDHPETYIKKEISLIDPAVLCAELQKYIIVDLS